MGSVLLQRVNDWSCHPDLGGLRQRSLPQYCAAYSVVEVSSAARDLFRLVKVNDNYTYILIYIYTPVRFRDGHQSLVAS
jgi:hypothetical protein